MHTFCGLKPINLYISPCAACVIYVYCDRMIYMYIHVDVCHYLDMCLELYYVYSRLRYFTAKYIHIMENFTKVVKYIIVMLKKCCLHVHVY